MIPDPNETIVALSSAPGPGGRAIVRLSGARALAVVQPVISLEATMESVEERRWYPGRFSFEGSASPLPVTCYVWPGPRTYTGHDIVEIHTVSCLPLVDLLVGKLLQAGARAAQPGEFTLRAFLAGKLDLSQAEAVLGVIEASSRDELHKSLAQLAGGMSRPLADLRNDLLNLLADVEAGLDFVEEDIEFVGRDDQLRRLARGMAQLTLLQKQLQQRAVSDRPFRIVLAGKPNAGKSSLFNALTGGSALVSSVPGTTRDYLQRRLTRDGITIELIDTAGLQATADLIDAQAQKLGAEQREKADMVLLCVESEEPAIEPDSAVLQVATKADLVSNAECGARSAEVATSSAECGARSAADLDRASGERLMTSAVTGEGIDELRDLLYARARQRSPSPLASSLSRCRHHVDECLQRLRQAHEMVLFEEPPELCALELRNAMDQLGEMTGTVYTEDLLGRIFSRFCIGK